MSATKIPPVSVKASLILVNDFISSTTRFLNHFSSLCEERLRAVSRDITRVETGLVLLESRLLRVPGMEEAGLPPPTAVALVVPSGTIGAVGGGAAGGAAAAPPPPPIPAGGGASGGVTAAPPPPPPATDSGVAAPPADAPPPPPPVARIDTHPDYAPLFKMLRLGVPMGNVKQKATALGLRTDVLEDPAAPITILGGDGGGGGGAAPAAPTAATPAAPRAPPPPPPPPSAPTPAPQPPPDAGKPALGPEYDKFLKMLKVGIPLGAVKSKAALEGLDPNLITG